MILLRAAAYRLAPRISGLVAVLAIGLPPAAAPAEASEPASASADYGETSTVSPSAEAVGAVETIEVVGRRMRAIDLENTARAIDVVDLAGMRDRAADMGLVLRQTNGIVIRQQGGLGSTAQLRLNGLSGRQVPLFVDGLPIELTGLPRNPTLIPVDLVRRIDVYKGVVPIELGADALGGAMNFVTHRPRDSQAFAGFEVSSFGTRRFTGDLQYVFPEIPIYVSARGFYDTSDNDYRVEVEIPNELGQPQPETVGRFHDAFENYGLSAAVGVRDLSWAHTLEIQGFFTESENELQHGVTLGRPFGEVTGGDGARGATLRYEQLAIANRADLQISANYTHRELRFVDLARNIYNWRGEVVGQRPGRGELTSGLEQTIEEELATVRANLSMEVAEDHTLALNLSPAWRRRSTSQRVARGDELEVRDRAPAEILELVGGVAYRSRWVDGDLRNDLFGKLYLLETEAQEVRVDFEVGAIEQSHTRFGAGDALVWTPNDWLGVRASYEFATRLPESTELLGDGALVAGNPALTPEESHNVNLSVQLSELDLLFARLDLSAWGFLREVDDLIFLEVGELLSRFSNVDSVRIFGVEGNLALHTWKDRLHLSGNLTWEEARNTALSGSFERFSDDRVPNRPYLYGSARLELRDEDLFSTGDEVQLWSALLYTHEYFLFWESAGDPDTKNTIPAQASVDVGVVYAHEFLFGDFWRVSTSFEVRNVTNAELFDFFRVPRPGRSYHTKIGVSFQ